MWRGSKTFVGKAADRITDLTQDRQAIFIRNAKCPHHIQPISQPAASADARRVRRLHPEDHVLGSMNVGSGLLLVVGTR